MAAQKNRSETAIENDKKKYKGPLSSKHDLSHESSILCILVDGKG
jgi:hypothetical protein